MTPRVSLSGAIQPSVGSACEGLRLLARPHPLHANRVDREVPAGGTILDLMALAQVDRTLLANARVVITDRAMRADPVIVPRQHWGRVRPKPGTVVLIQVVPGKGGGKSPLATILSIGVMIASIAYGGALGAELLGAELAGAELFTIGAAKFTVGGLVGGGIISLVGAAAISAIAPPGQPRLSETSGQLFSQLTSPTLAITGSQNRANPLGPVPSLLGEHRIFPTVGARSYTEVIGNDQYYRMLFDLGPGPIELDDMRIGTVPLAQYEGVETEIREGYPDDEPIGLFSQVIQQDGYNLKLTQAGGARSLETRDAADEFIFDISANGVVSFGADGNRNSHSVQIQVDYRLAGSGGAYSTAGLTYPDGTAVPAGLVTVTAATEQIVRQGIRGKPAAAGRYEIRYVRVTADNNSTQVRDDTFITAVRTVRYARPTKTVGNCQIAMRIKASNQLSGIVDLFSVVAKRLVPTWDSIAGWSEPVDVSGNPAWLALEVMRGKANKKPIPDSRLDLPTWLAFAQRNADLDQNGEPKFRFDMNIDTRGTVRQVVTEILASARAVLTTRDGKWSVWWDRVQTVPVQMFTPHNSWGLEWEKRFIDRPHALKVRYVEPELDWQQDEVTVYDDGYNEDGSGGLTAATLFETLEDYGSARRSQAWRCGRYRQADSKLRPDLFRLNVDVEHLQCPRGSLVKVNHPKLRRGIGSGRIKALAVDEDDYVTAVTLDEPVPMEPGKVYGLRIRTNVMVDGEDIASQVTATVVTPSQVTETATLTLSPPVTPLAGIAVGDLVAFGEATKEAVDMIVHGLRRFGKLSAQLELVDAAPAVHDADTGPIPAYDPQQTFPAHVLVATPPKPIIAEIVSDERAMVPSPAGGWQLGIDVYLTPQSGVAAAIEKLEGRFRPAGSNQPWTLASALPFADKIRLAPVEQGIAYELRLVNLSAERPGLASDATYVASHIVVGRSALPPNVTTVTISDGKLDAPGFAAPIDLAGFKISYKVGEDRVYGGAVSAHPANDAVPLPFDISHLPTGTLTIFVAALDTSGNESAAPAIVVQEITGVVRQNIVEDVDYRALAWLGTITGGTVSGGDLVANGGAAFVPAGDGAPFVPAADNAAFVPSDLDGSWDELVYVATLQPNSFWLPAQLTVDRTIVGQATVDYRTDAETLFVPADDNAPFVPADDNAAFVPALGDWQPFPGGIVLKSQIYEIRATVAAGNVQGKIQQLKAVVDVEDVEEPPIVNLAIAAGTGTRLALTKTYKFGVTDPGVTLLADGGAATGVRVTIDNLPPGPLIECLSTSGAVVAGHINAKPKGY